MAISGPGTVKCDMNLARRRLQGLHHLRLVYFELPDGEGSYCLAGNVGICDANRGIQIFEDGSQPRELCEEEREVVFDYKVRYHLLETAAIEALDQGIGDGLFFRAIAVQAQ